MDLAQAVSHSRALARRTAAMLAAALLLLAADQPAPSRSLFTAGELQDRCNAGGDANIAYCYAYVAGVYDAVRAYETWLNMREFCAPVGVTQSELRRAFLDYMTVKPGFRSGEAASVVVVALKEQYACTAKPASKPYGSEP
jgi:hypothetical protein